MTDKVIVFDLGKVIFDYDLSFIAKSLSEILQNQAVFDDVESFIYNNMSFFADYEKGLVSSVSFYNRCISSLGIKNLSFESFCNVWNNIFSPNQDTIDLILKLSKKHKLALLSNTNDLHFNFLYQKYQNFFDNNFQKLFLSYEMKQRKPDKDIYLSVIDFYKTDAQNIFFTDDKQENIDTAKEIGIKAYTFKNVEKLKQDLKDFGIEV